MIIAERISDLVCGPGNRGKPMPTPTKIILFVGVVLGCVTIAAAIGGVAGLLTIQTVLTVAVPSCVSCVGCGLFIFLRRTLVPPPPGSNVGQSSQRGSQPPNLPQAGPTPSVQPNPPDASSPPKWRSQPPKLPPAGPTPSVQSNPPDASPPSPPKWVVRLHHNCIIAVDGSPKGLRGQPLRFDVDDPSKYADVLAKVQQRIIGDAYDGTVELLIDDSGTQDSEAWMLAIPSCPGLHPHVCRLSLPCKGAEIGNLQRLIQDLVNLQTVSLHCKVCCKLPIGITRALCNLEKLRGVTLENFNAIGFPDDCRTNIADLYVYDCASFDPGGFSALESLENLTLRSVVFAGKDYPGGLLHLKTLEVNVETLKQNGEFFSRVKLPAIQTLIVDLSNFHHRRIDEQANVYACLKKVVPGVKSLTIGGGYNFDIRNILLESPLCESIQLAFWNGDGTPTSDLMDAIVTAKKNGELPKLQTIKFPKGALAALPSQRFNLLKGVGLKAEELPQ